MNIPYGAEIARAYIFWYCTVLCTNTVSTYKIQHSNVACAFHLLSLPHQVGHGEMNYTTSQTILTSSARFTRKSKWKSRAIKSVIDTRSASQKLFKKWSSAYISKQDNIGRHHSVMKTQFKYMSIFHNEKILRVTRNILQKDDEI